MDLEGIPFKPTRHEGISIHFYDGDRATGRAAVAIKMEPGRGYPPHRHRGTEDVLVLQGGYRDERGEHRAGDYVRYEDGTAHGPVALEGEACILFAITERGVEGV